MVHFSFKARMPPTIPTASGMKYQIHETKNPTAEATITMMPPGFIFPNPIKMAPVISRQNTMTPITTRTIQKYVNKG